MKKLIIEKAAVKHNAAVLKERAGKSAIYAVLSGDGGGAGLVELARLLRGEGIGRFAVSEPAEAAALRKAGFVDEEILMLRATTDPEELEQLVDLNVVCTVSSIETGAALNGVAEARSTVVEAHLQVDTGLGFGGFLVDEPDKILLAYRSLSNVAISGIYTQIQGTTKQERAQAQLALFDEMLSLIHKEGFETGTVHVAGSYALLHFPGVGRDAVRAGSAILGRCRRARGDGLQTVGTGETAISETHWLPKGHTVGTQKLVHLRRPTRVAVLPVGYQNGLGVERHRAEGLWQRLRAALGRRRFAVRIEGQRAPVIGDIGAVQTLVDVTDLKCSAGDVAQFDIDPAFAKGLTREYR